MKKRIATAVAVAALMVLTLVTAVLADDGSSMRQDGSTFGSYGELQAR